LLTEYSIVKMNEISTIREWSPRNPYFSRARDCYYLTTETKGIYTIFTGYVGVHHEQ